MILRTVLMVALITAATRSEAQVRYTAFAGPQIRSARYTVGGNPQPTSYKPGVIAGLAMKVPFDNHLFFYPTFFYNLKGYKVTLNDPSFPPTEFAVNNNTTIHTMEIAPLFQIDIGKKASHWFFRVGPSVDIAFSGTESFDTIGLSGQRGHVDRPMKFSFGDYGRISASAHLHLGYELEKGYQVFAFYQHGIGSMNNADDGPAILHRIIGIGAGWYFATSKP